MSPPVLTIKSRFRDYSVDEFQSVRAALQSVPGGERAIYLVDRGFASLYGAEIAQVAPADRVIRVDATESSKSLESLAPLVLELLSRGIKRDGVIVVVGGGTLQDVGCFVASVLFRGVRWELLPTTLLAQADSCLGSKSSLNVGAYKNQLGTFYPPDRVLLVPGVLRTLPWDEIRSGLGEVIKLQLLGGEAGFRELMDDLGQFQGDSAVLSKWVGRSMAVKKTYIETDEYDQGIRNLLNYGHTFGHSYESATQYRIPHGIAVILGVLTATRLSARLGLVPSEHYAELRLLLAPWHQPYGAMLREASRDEICSAIKLDKKNTGGAVNCIVTRGFGMMEKCAVSLEADVVPAMGDFIDDETAATQLS